jgi:hypothetical protein
VVRCAEQGRHLKAQWDGYSDGLCRLCAAHAPGSSHALSSPERVPHPFREPLHFIVISVIFLYLKGFHVTVPKQVYL